MELPYAVRTQLNDINAFTLAHTAGIANPDSLESPGAKMLTNILSDIVERVEYLDGVDIVDADSLRDALDDELHEVADNAPDVYAAGRWAQFVDLAAWDADLSDYGVESIDLMSESLTDVAGKALYCVTREVVDASVQLIGDMMSEFCERAVERAAKSGADSGRDAADWWAQDVMGGRSPGDAAPTARAVLAGFADGDPAILDSIPTADLSGQMADAPTLAGLLTDVDLDGFDVAGQMAQDVADAWTVAFDTAVESHLTDIAQSVINAAE